MKNMSRITKNTLAFLLALGTWQCVSGAAPANYEQDFKTLTEKNIFSRQRIIRKQERDFVPPQPPPKPPKYSSYVLIGISSINGKWNAFFEDILQGGCQIVKVGDEFESGVVNAIDADAVTYTRGEEKLSLVIGSDMKGVTEVSSAAVEPDVEATEDTSDSSTSGGGEDEALKRLMERRNKELK